MSFVLFTTDSKDVSVVSASIDMPIHGAWKASMELDGDSPAIGDACTIIAPDSQWSGTVIWSQSEWNRVKVVVVGGKGKLSEECEPQQFKEADVKLLVKDTLGAETISSSSDASILGKSFPWWVRYATPRTTALDSIVSAADANWRVLDDGSVWVGVDSFPAVSTIAWELSDAHQKITMATDYPTIRPGITLNTRKIVHVSHVFGASIRTIATYTK